MTPDPVLVLGATGTQGGAIARSLLDRAVPVRALVRDRTTKRALELARLGAALVVGDLTDERSLTRAFSDVPVVYAITTPFEHGADAEVSQGEAITHAAAHAGLSWLIFASVAAAGRAPVPHFRSKAQIEARLHGTSVPWTVVAPSYFYDNVLGAGKSVADGVLPLPLPVHTPLQQVALRDLGALVAAILGRRDEHLYARVEVAADSPTPEEMARALGVHAVESSIDALAERNPDLAAMYIFLADTGYGIDVPALRATYPEIAWSTFAEWAAEQEWPVPTIRDQDRDHSDRSPQPKGTAE